MKRLGVPFSGYNSPMTQNAIVRSRINSDVKEQASIVLEAMGLSVSDVMRIVLTCIAREGALPFELKLTRTNLHDRTHGQEVHIVGNAEDLSPQFST